MAAWAETSRTEAFKLDSPNPFHLGKHASRTWKWLREPKLVVLEKNDVFKSILSSLIFKLGTNNIVHYTWLILKYCQDKRKHVFFFHFFCTKICKLSCSSWKKSRYHVGNSLILWHCTDVIAAWRWSVPNVDTWSGTLTVTRLHVMFCEQLRRTRLFTFQFAFF